MTTSCPICAAAPARTVTAGIADFITVMCALPLRTPAQAHHCAACDHAFLTPFLSRAQLAGLYQTYQGRVYNDIRLSLEPWYQGVADVFADQTSEHWLRRLAFYRGRVPACVSSVVDFGGKDGWLARQVFPNAKVVVVDEGFEGGGGNMADTLAGCDLLFAAHVFEHLPQPTAELRRLSRHLQPGTLVWLEVPLEYTGALKDHFDRFEALPQEGPSAPLRYLHEHVAHFSRSSLEALARKSDLEPLEYHVVPEHGLQAVMAVKQ